MPDFDTNRGAATKGKDDHKDILAQARKDWDAAEARERHNIKLAYEDLEFLSGDEYAQWDAKALKERTDEGRPTLQINQLPQFVHQITGDIRQMKPAIKVVPVDSHADEKIADLRAGLIRYVENRSDASAIYFRTADSQVACGIGHWRVLTEYADSSTFNQELRIGPVEDGVAVLWDPDSVLPTREDARFCFVPVDMSRNAFEAAHPGITPSSFDDATWQHNSSWCTDDFVRVAEYWVKKPTRKLLALGLDGSISDITDADESVLAFHKGRGARIEWRDSTKVCRYLITASNVLEDPGQGVDEYKGRFIPIVPVVGEEIRIGRKLIRNGIVRHAKDPQRMSNYFHSAHTEIVALQPKAPFMVTEVNVAKYQPTWETANTKNYPYLPYTPDSLNGGVAPQRIQPPVSSQGVLDGLTMAKDDLRAVIGIHDAGVGERQSGESGKAILALQREGDVGSYLYIDNFARAVRHTGNILNDLIPHIYDTERTIRIMGEDGKIDVMEINKASGLDPESGETAFDHDITVGSYDVVAQIGPSFSTRREEARDSMVEFVRSAPETAPLILDLIAKAQDWPMHDDIAKRLRATLPPKILQIEAMEKQGATPEQIDQFLSQGQEPPPDPRMMKVQQDGQIAQAKMAAEQEATAAKLMGEQQQAMAQLQLEMRRMAEESQQSQRDFMLAMKQMFLDSQTKIEVAQINAGAGMHKNIIHAGTEEMKTQTSAEIEFHKANTAAETARYATDNRPQPNGAGQSAS